jgi:prepilin-type N-terminal cleavage/methylation domain-containing protein
VTAAVPVRRPGSDERGFTLVEVLVGALVLGIFISFIYGVVISAFRVRGVIESSTSALASGTMAVDLVARDLENAVILPFKDFDAFKAEDEGNSTRLTFVTSMDSRRQEEVEGDLLRTDMAETGFAVRQGDDGLILYRRETFGIDDKPLDGGDWYKVVEGVREFRIQWYADDPSEENGDEENDALDEWNAKEEKKLPRSAKITLILEGNSTNPDAAGQMLEYTFVRWVVLPGADDALPENAEGGGNNPGGPGGR